MRALLKRSITRRDNTYYKHVRVTDMYASFNRKTIREPAYVSRIYSTRPVRVQRVLRRGVKTLANGTDFRA